LRNLSDIFDFSNLISRDSIKEYVHKILGIFLETKKSFLKFTLNTIVEAWHFVT